MFPQRSAPKGEIGMKIKGSTRAIKPEYLNIAFAASFVICLGLRFYHSIKLIDAETGFYSKPNFTVAVFYVILAAVGAFLLIGSFVSKNNGKFDAESVIGKNKPLGAISIILAVSFVTEFGQSVINAIYSVRNSVIETDVSYFAQLMKSGYIPNILVAAFAAFSSLYFMVFAVSCLGKRVKITSKKIFALMPVGWALTKLISFFVKQISFIRVSDLLLEIAAMIFTALFLFSLAQCVSGVYADVAEWRLTGVGLTAALLLLTLNIPRFFLTVFGGSAHVVSGYPVNYAELFCGIFILALIFSLSKGEKVPEPCEAPEAAEEKSEE